MMPLYEVAGVHGRNQSVPFTGAARLGGLAANYISNCLLIKILLEAMR